MAQNCAAALTSPKTLIPTCSLYLNYPKNEMRWVCRCNVILLDCCQVMSNDVERFCLRSCCSIFPPFERLTIICLVCSVCVGEIYGGWYLIRWWQRNLRITAGCFFQSHDCGCKVCIVCKVTCVGCFKWLDQIWNHCAKYCWRAFNILELIVSDWVHICFIGWDTKWTERAETLERIWVSSECIEEEAALALAASAAKMPQRMQVLTCDATLDDLSAALA